MTAPPVILCTLVLFTHAQEQTRRQERAVSLRLGVCGAERQEGTGSVHKTTVKRATERDSAKFEGACAACCVLVLSPSAGRQEVKSAIIYNYIKLSINTFVNW